MKEENGGTSPAKKKWMKKGYNPEEWIPDLAGVSLVAPCSLWRLATAQRNSSTPEEYRVPTMAGPHSPAGGALEDDAAAIALPFACLGAIVAMEAEGERAERKFRRAGLEAEAREWKWEQ